MPDKYLTEVWKDVLGFEGRYQVSNCGRVRSIRRTVLRKRAGRMTHRFTIPGRVLHPIAQSNSGHLFVGLHRNNGSKSHSIHRLVLETFVGLCPVGMECLHADGDPTNNHVSNLKWGTHQENCNDTIRHGRSNFCPGSNHQNAKLTMEDVAEIERLYATGRFTYQQLGKRFCVHKESIARIIHKKSWHFR